MSFQAGDVAIDKYGHSGRRRGLRRFVVVQKPIPKFRRCIVVLRGGTLSLFEDERLEPVDPFLASMLKEQGYFK
jgi:hypothetical protein